MNSLHSLYELVKATNALVNLPLSKLQENKKFTDDIKKIVSPENVSNILNSVKQDIEFEKNYVDNPIGNTNPESLEFTKKFVNLENIKYDSYSNLPSTENYITDIPTFQKKDTYLSVTNSLNDTKQKLVETKEAKEFKEVYNSIFSDHALKIGTSKDPTWLQSYIDYSPYVFNYPHYLAIPTLSQTVDRPISMALKKQPVIDFKNDKLDEFFSYYLKKEKIVSKLKKFLLYSTLSPRGSLIVPMKGENGKVTFGVYNDTQFTYSVSPVYSRYSYSDIGVNEVYLFGKVLKPDVSCHFYCSGFEPLYGIGKNKLIPLKNASEAINIYIYTIKVLCIRSQVLVQKWSGDGQTDTLLAAIKKTTEQIDSTLSLNTSVKLPEGSELTLLNNNLSEGFAKISPIIKEFQAILTGLAPDYLYGSDTAYSANNFNIQMSHQAIRSEIQEEAIEPALRYMVNTCLEYDPRLFEYRKEVDNFEIKFDSLYEPTGIDKVNEDKEKINNIIAMSAYPELEEIFKKENLFPKDSTLSPNVEKPEMT